jgi:hypothetical protein
VSSRRLANGQDSRGFVPIELEVLERRLSLEAVGLLALMRRESALTELDGMLDQAAVGAAGSYGRADPKQLRRALAELAEAQAVKITRTGGVVDLNYAVWSKTRADRERDRAKWRGRKRAYREAAGGEQLPLDAAPMSHGDAPGNPRENPPWSPTENHRGIPEDSTVPEAEAEAEADRGPSVPSLGNSASQPARAIGDALVAELAAFVAGNELSAADQRRVRDWPYAFGHLVAGGVEAFLEPCRAAIGEGELPRSVRYFEGPLGDADMAAADQRQPAGRAHEAGLHRAGRMLSSPGNAQPGHSAEEV